MNRFNRLLGGFVSALLLAGCGDAVAGRSVASGSPHPSAAPRLADGESRSVSCSTKRLPATATGPMSWRASLDGVAAELTATVTRQDGWQLLDQPVLTLTERHGQPWRVPVRPAEHSLARRVLSYGVNVRDRPAGLVCLVRFAARATPVAVVSVNAGGAHCCTTLRIYDAVRRTESALDTGNMDATIAMAGGGPVVQTRDDRFSYAFTAFAYSGAPLQLMRPAAGGLVNVTREFPRLIGRDAARWWRFVRRAHSPSELVGFLAAWAADEEMLGRDGQVWRTVDDLNALGKLGPDGHDFGWPRGDAYVGALRSFLRTSGYLG